MIKMKKVQSFFTKLLLVMAVISICLNGLGMFAKVHADTAAFQMDARAAYAIDAESGQVLYQKNATKRYPIASVIKILTLGVILQDIRNHHLKWDQ